MKYLKLSEVTQLVHQYRAKFKLIEKQEASNTKIWSPLMDDAFILSGKFVFVITVVAPENFTELSESSDYIIQNWELKENVKINQNYFLKFECWGEPPLMEHEGKLLLVPTDYFADVIYNLNELNSNMFSFDKLKNTQGFENIEFK